MNNIKTQLINYLAGAPAEEAQADGAVHVVAALHLVHHRL